MLKAFLLSRKTLALLLLVLVGLVRLPMEEKLSQELRDKQLLETPVGLDMTESLGQMGMAASLGGLRALVASITYLMAYGDFEDVNWEGVRRLMWITTRLEPHNRAYWEEASWHMAYNATAYYQRDKNLRPAIREKLIRDHVQMGKDILEEGLRYLPNNPSLWLRLGQILQDKQFDDRRAAEAYLECYAKGGEKYQYAERMAAYEMVKLSDRPSWERAYEILKKYYDRGMRKAGTSIMRDLPILEERLNIPKDQRVKPLPEDLPHYQPKIPRVPGTALPK
jgi:hypothetical protein